MGWGTIVSPLSLSEKSSNWVTQDNKCLVWILTYLLFAVGPVMGHSAFCQQEKITTASASSSKYPNAVAKERAATRNFKTLRVNWDAGLGYSSVLWSYLRDSLSTWLELLFFSASVKIMGACFLPSLHQLAVLPRAIWSLPWPPMCSLVLTSTRKKNYQGPLNLKFPSICRILLSQNLLKVGTHLWGIFTIYLPCSFYKRQDIGLY